MSRRCLRAVALAGMLLCCGLARGQEGGLSPGTGHLVIVGGGLKADNAPVYQRVFEHMSHDGPLCVIPTASAKPREAAASATRALARHAPEGTIIATIELTRDDPLRADDSGAAAQVRSCASLWFTGGDQTRITDVFRPGGRETAALVAAKELLSGGGIIAGSSAGAAMMSDPMITGGSSRTWITRAKQAAPEDEAHGEAVAPEPQRIGAGLGFFPYGIVDQHFLARGRLGRLVLALEASEIDRGFGVADNCALYVDLASGRIEAIGQDAVILVDISGLDRAGGWNNVRISLLGTGDAVDGNTGELTPAARRTRVAREPREPASETAPDSSGAKDEIDLRPWSRDAVLTLVRQLAENPGIPAIATEEGLELRLSADDQTRFYTGDGGKHDLCAIDVRLDLIVR